MEKISRFFRTIIWNIVFWTIMVVTMVLVPIVYLLGKIGDGSLKAKFLSQLVNFWSNTLLFFSGSKLTVIGKENIPDDHSYCVVSNHQGYFDIPVILNVIPWTVGFVAKKELKKIPFLSVWMDAIGVVYLDRKDRRGAIDVIRTASERINSGQPMVIFPEGTRSKGGPVKEFKQGSLKLATLAKTKILPITLDGTYQLIEGVNWGINPAEIRVTIHPVIDTNTLSDEEIKTLGKQLKDIIEAPLLEKKQ